MPNDILFPNTLYLNDLHYSCCVHIRSSYTDKVPKITNFRKHQFISYIISESFIGFRQVLVTKLTDKPITKQSIQIKLI